MKISLSTEPVTKVKADLVAVGVRKGKFAQSKAFQALDEAMGGALKRQATEEGFEGESGEVLKVPASGKVAAPWVALVGLGGKPEAWTARLVGGKAASAVRKQRSVAVALPGLCGEPEEVRLAVEGVLTGAYRYDRYKTGDRKPKGGLRAATMLVSRAAPAKLKRATAEGQALGEAINLARDLVNDPPNDLHPTALAKVAKAAMAKAGGKCTVLGKKRLEQERMGLLLAVSRGTSQEPKLIHMVHKPARAKKRVVFVGKGLTFDSGGLCIKPGKFMEDMKCDMAGAATTVGILVAAAKLKLPIEVHGIIGATENMPGADAYRPGDVFTSREGKTVEIINTDAEGRLVLVDVLHYGAELNPDYMIDHATLTGACMVALGKWTAALFANDEGAGERYAAAAKEAGESYWRMPLTEDIRETLKSDVADLKHTGDVHGGSISAALFLSEFVGKASWVHCDIAGPAFLSAAHGIEPKGGTGFGISTGIQFLENLAAG